MEAFAAQVLALPRDEFWLLFGVAVLVTLGALVFGFRSLGRARLILDTPTSRIASAAQGYVELEGQAGWLPGPPIQSPLSGARCVWWDYQVEKKHRDSRNRTSWRTVVKATSDDLFLLSDASGDCIVDPHGARVIPSFRRRWQGHARRPAQIPEKSPLFSFGSYRYTERLLKFGDALYALGGFHTQHGVQCFDENESVRTLLAEWKRDRVALLERFDANNDGEIDLEEWETVRRAALEAVRQKHVEQAVHPDLNILSQPRDRRPYLLSGLPQTDLIRRKRGRASALLILALAAFVFSSLLIEVRFG